MTFGPDSVPSIVLLKYARAFSTTVSYLFNNSLKKGVSHFLEVIIYSIHKKLIEIIFAII